MGISQKELEKRGFSIDLDSNAQEIPVGIIRSGLSGGMETGNRKIHPNDPCPCGSGKNTRNAVGRAGEFITSDASMVQILYLK